MDVNFITKRKDGSEVYPYRDIVYAYKENDDELSFVFYGSESSSTVKEMGFPLDSIIKVQCDYPETDIDRGVVKQLKKILGDDKVTVFKPKVKRSESELEMLEFTKQQIHRVQDRLVLAEKVIDKILKFMKIADNPETAE